MRFALLIVLREPVLRAVATFLFAPRFEAALRLREERLRELPLRVVVRELRKEEEARELREREEEPRDDLLDELRFDLPPDRDADERRFERAEVRGELLLPDRERRAPPLSCLLPRDALLRLFLAGLAAR